MNPDFLAKIYTAHQSPKILPGTEEIAHFIQELLLFLFPELNDKRLNSLESVEAKAAQLTAGFKGLLLRTEACDNQNSACKQFFGRLEEIHELCLEDADAICKGDPAAYDIREVIRSYPGFLAIAIYRIAHLMHQLQIPYLPRIFTEYAHANTGIDIHPGACIGRRFCIDHGTGVVIGETTHIGNDVKVYQGVTLGALSVRKEMARQKRHPTIEDRTVIYAGATILGGETVIGQDSIIGGGVWLTNSVSANSTVYYAAKGNQIVKEISE